MSRNLLDRETSPYLLLHKDNPVHWRSWGADALDEAETTGKPILLSIGYTACHWCSIMSRESFDDPEIAAFMNENFVNILVDREERPDLDQLYQIAASSMGSSGGWPLNMFLMPRGEPFVAAGYLPKEDRGNQPSFRRALEDVLRAYREQPEALANTVTRVQSTLAQLWSRDLRGPLDATQLDAAAVKIAQRYDIFYGGMSGPAKFPTTGLTELLWRAYLRTGVSQFAQQVQTTLDNMCLGGLYDHVGGGFYRYTQDERWLIPTFEKLLSDNALIIALMTIVVQHSRSNHLADRIQDSIEWVLREMKNGDAFASSLCGATDGEDGRYYLWSEAEIDAALMGTFVQRFKEAYGVRREGNFQATGKNLLHRFGKLVFPLPEADEALLKKQRELLRTARSKRAAPMRDDKVLADWNGMMITSLAQAAMVFRNVEWLNAAKKAFDFVATTMSDGDRLYHSWRDGKRGHTGFADDYAHMARAGLALWEATGEARYLERTEAWVRTLNEHFWDTQNGGLFHSPDDAEPLFIRPRMVFDQSVPSGNGVMAGLFAQLFFITADQSYRERANAIIQAFSGEVGRAFASMGTFLNGFETTLTGLEIVIIGPRKNPKTQELIIAVTGRSVPTRTLHTVESSDALPPGHAAFGKSMENGQPTAYVCQRMTCSAPITNPVTLSQVLVLPPPRAQGQA